MNPAEVAAAAQAVAPAIWEHLPWTPLVEFAAAGEATGATILVKCEHQQRTGSFKVRGSLAKVSLLDDNALSRGVVTASTGNHGLGVAYALRASGTAGTICVPHGASPAKLAALARFGNVEILTMGQEAAETEGLARQLAAERGATFISPYNDRDVIAGQATIALEILEQLGDRRVDAVVASVGGGGMISGVGSVLKAARPQVHVVGSSPANDAAMAACVQAGAIIDIATSPTLSDGTAGGIEPGSITYPLCRDVVDEWILVSEQEIAEALRLAIDTEHTLIEGAAGVALAAGMRYATEHPGQTIVVVSCGGNISADKLVAALGR